MRSEQRPTSRPDLKGRSTLRVASCRSRSAYKGCSLATTSVSDTPSSVARCAMVIGPRSMGTARSLPSTACPRFTSASIASALSFGIVAAEISGTCTRIKDQNACCFPDMLANNDCTGACHLVTLLVGLKIHLGAEIHGGGVPNTEGMADQQNRADPPASRHDTGCVHNCTQQVIQVAHFTAKQL